MTIEELRESITRIIDQCVQSLADAGHIEEKGMIVLGCSTSEIAGARIGKGSMPEYGIVIAQAMLSTCRERGLYAAFQCCEHLNRALVMEREALIHYSLTQVHAVPQPKAGGSVAAAAWKLLEHPVLAASCSADAAIDIGDTLVGMHIRPVAVPLRCEESHIGEARIVMAYSRLPLIGGERAVYA